MNIESGSNGHWTDEQIIEHLYDVGPADGHLSSCRDCLQRLRLMQTRRQSVDGQVHIGNQAGDEVSFDFLAAQRRKVYARLDAQVGWRRTFEVRRWAPVALALLMIGAGVAVFEETHSLGFGEHDQTVINSNISDAELVSDVSRFADDSEPKSTAPLQALFEE